MKQKTIAILLTVALLAGCNTPAPAAPSATDEPDMEAIIQQSVDEAVKERLEQIEEEQKKKDEEIAKLKEQLEDLTAQSEALPEENSSAPAENTSSQAPASSQPAASASSSQPEIPPQPEPEPPPQSAPAPKKTTPSSSGGGFDLKNLYPDYVWEGSVEEPEEQEPEDEPYEDDSDSAPSGGYHRLEDALEVIQLTNQEREKNGLPALEVDEDLMELARIRAVEIREKYSHTRPDGTTVVDLRCGENCGQDSSAARQVTAWMNSDGHRTNILLDRYHHIGAGCYQAPNGNLYWVQVFSLD